MAEPSRRRRIASVLEPLFEEHGEWGNLADVLEQQVEDVEDPAGRASLLVRIAELREHHQHDRAGAFRAYARALVCEPSDGLTREALARLVAELGDYEPYVRALEGALGVEALTSETRVELLRELGQTLDTHLADPHRTQEAYRRLLAAEPGDVEVRLDAYRVLRRLHAEAGQYDQVAQDLRCQLDFESEQDERSRLLRELAETLAAHLDDAAGAIAAQQERVALNPDDEGPLRALEELYGATEQWTALVDVLRARQELVHDGAERKRLALSIGAVYRERLNDSVAAIAAYQDAVEQFGPESQTLELLADLYQASERWQDLHETLETAAGIEDERAKRLELRFRAAQVLHEHLREWERSLDEYAVLLGEETVLWEGD